MDAGRRADDQRMFAGRNLHRLQRDGDGFLIARKQIEPINYDDRFDMIAVPIWASCSNNAASPWSAGVSAVITLVGIADR